MTIGEPDLDDLIRYLEGPRDYPRAQLVAKHKCRLPECQGLAQKIYEGYCASCWKNIQSWVGHHDQ